jgi:predicted amidohydrolase
VREVALLQLKNNPNYQKNLDKILKYINELPKDTIIVAPEVCLTDYDYDNLKKACEFSEYALKELLKIVNTQVLVLTLLRKVDNSYINQAVVIHKNKIIHKQAKHKLFKLGDEHLFLEAGDDSNIVKFKIDNLEFGLLICFELRYKELWQKLEGADIIFVPSQWGEPRKRHLEILAQALAVMNQCYVLVANSSKDTMAKSSAIYAPMGGKVIDDASECIRGFIDLKQIKFMRRYIRIDN